ncbi:MAG: class I SAM-dependent methyltransferase [Myxococcota bacterium]
MDRYTSGAYAERNPDWHEGDAEHKAAALAALIRYAGLEPRTVVDVGCGTGAVLDGLSRALGAELPATSWEGWDPSPEAIARASPRERPGLSFCCGDFLASERRADLVVCADVVEHVQDDLGWLRGLREHANDFVLRIPLDLSVLDVARPGRMLALRRDQGHLHAYTRERAAALLEDAGLRVEVERYDRVPPPRDTVRRLLVDGVRSTLVRVAPHRAVRWLGGFSWLVVARRRRSVATGDETWRGPPGPR